MAITFPSNTKDIIDDIRDAVGRTITFNVLVSQSGCSACSLDPVTNTSTDSFCTTCGSKYWINTYTDSEVTAHVRWKSMDKENRYTGGSVFEGDCRVQLEYSAANITIINNSETVEVDGKLMSIEKQAYKGIPELNRIVLILNEEETDV